MTIGGTEVSGATLSEILIIVFWSVLALGFGYFYRRSIVNFLFFKPQDSSGQQVSSRPQGPLKTLNFDKAAEDKKWVEQQGPEYYRDLRAKMAAIEKQRAQRAQSQSQTINFDEY